VAARAAAVLHDAADWRDGAAIGARIESAVCGLLQAELTEPASNTELGASRATAFLAPFPPALAGDMAAAFDTGGADVGRVNLRDFSLRALLRDVSGCLADGQTHQAPILSTALRNSVLGHTRATLRLRALAAPCAGEAWAAAVATLQPWSLLAVMLAAAFHCDMSLGLPSAVACQYTQVMLEVLDAADAANEHALSADIDVSAFAAARSDGCAASDASSATGNSVGDGSLPLVLLCTDELDRRLAGRLPLRAAAPAPAEVEVPLAVSTAVRPGSLLGLGQLAALSAPTITPLVPLSAPADAAGGQTPLVQRQRPPPSTGGTLVPATDAGGALCVRRLVAAVAYQQLGLYDIAQTNVLRALLGCVLDGGDTLFGVMALRGMMEHMSTPAEPTSAGPRAVEVGAGARVLPATREALIRRPRVTKLRSAAIVLPVLLSALQALLRRVDPDTGPPDALWAADVVLATAFSCLPLLVSETVPVAAGAMGVRGSGAAYGGGAVVTSSLVAVTSNDPNAARGGLLCVMLLADVFAAYAHALDDKDGNNVARPQERARVPHGVVSRLATAAGHAFPVLARWAASIRGGSACGVCRPRLTSERGSDSSNGDSSGSDYCRHISAGVGYAAASSASTTRAARHALHALLRLADVLAAMPAAVSHLHGRSGDEWRSTMLALRALSGELHVAAGHEQGARAAGAPRGGAGAGRPRAARGSLARGRGRAAARGRRGQSTAVPSSDGGADSASDGSGPVATWRRPTVTSVNARRARGPSQRGGRGRGRGASAPQLRSRNAWVDRWLREDGGGGGDSFADLDDFIED
jgi:hypothetical protein